MITAQDIREKTFEKARFSGYDMASVDDFLEELAEDVTATQKENAVLKSKMKVLVDKIEEYRANEDALNMAVLSAQKLAVQIENDARARASAMLAEADKQVKAKVGSIAEQTAAQEGRYREVLRRRTRPVQHPAQEYRRHQQRHNLLSGARSRSRAQSRSAFCRGRCAKHRKFRGTNTAGAFHTDRHTQDRGCSRFQACCPV